LEKGYGTVTPATVRALEGIVGEKEVISGEGVSVEEWPEKAEEIFDEMSRIALALGGAGSGEHGVGTLKRSLFLKTKTETELALMRGIKRVFDPHGILNPGTIL